MGDKHRPCVCKRWDAVWRTHVMNGLVLQQRDGDGDRSIGGTVSECYFKETGVIYKCRGAVILEGTCVCLLDFRGL